MIFKFEVDTSNSVFDGSMTDVATELRREFEVATDRLIAGQTSMTVLDINGNTVGSWSYTPADDTSLNRRAFDLLRSYEESPGLANGFDVDEKDRVLNGDGRYLLVEHSRFGGVWVTRHNSFEDAAAYHTNQEFLEDWIDCELVDLESGQEKAGITRTTFE